MYCEKCDKFLPVVAAKQRFQGALFARTALILGLLVLAWVFISLRLALAGLIGVALFLVISAILQPRRYTCPFCAATLIPTPSDRVASGQSSGQGIGPTAACVACGSEMPTSANYCPTCGARVTVGEPSTSKA